MKKLFILLFWLCLLSSCKNHGKKLFIKTVSNHDSSLNIDWYFHSLLSNFSRSYVQLRTNEEAPKIIFESFYQSDIRLNSDTLLFQVFDSGYKLDPPMGLKTKFKIVIDTSGEFWNAASSRLPRIKRMNVDITKPHYTNSYCPNYGCD